MRCLSSMISRRCWIKPLDRSRTGFWELVPARRAFASTRSRITGHVKNQRKLTHPGVALGLALAVTDEAFIIVCGCILEPHTKSGACSVVGERAQSQLWLFLPAPLSVALIAEVPPSRSWFCRRLPNQNP